MSHKVSPPSPRNKTIALEDGELEKFKSQLVFPTEKMTLKEVENKCLCGDTFEVISLLPHGFVDLLFLDPMYNLDKEFDDKRYKEVSLETYMEWVEKWLVPMLPLLKPNASVYICADWKSSAAVHMVAKKYLTIRNRITWEREKGRGSRKNWKNCQEDIWYCTLDKKDFKFDIDSVKLKKKVLAPYREDSRPKDWTETKDGNVRLTCPSNLWTDLTIPFWSMPENTEHPFQKPEKLLAKIILASTDPGDMVFDPFSGSGTSMTVAKKLDRRWSGNEQSEVYACIGVKRLKMADKDKSIQGYTQGVFLDRNMSNAV